MRKVDRAILFVPLPIDIPMHGQAEHYPAATSLPHKRPAATRSSRG